MTIIDAPMAGLGDVPRLAAADALLVQQEVKQ
jgi:hypothetical protein